MMTMSQVVHGTAPAAPGDGGESRGGRPTAPGAEQQGLDQAPNTPAATGDGGESRGGRHTAPGAEQQGLDQAPNTGGTLDLQRHREESASSVGDVSRESADGELLAHHANPINISSRRPSDGRCC